MILVTAVFKSDQDKYTYIILNKWISYSSTECQPTAYTWSVASTGGFWYYTAYPWVISLAQSVNTITLTPWVSTDIIDWEYEERYCSMWNLVSLTYHLQHDSKSSWKLPLDLGCLYYTRKREQHFKLFGLRCGALWVHITSSHCKE